VSEADSEGDLFAPSSPPDVMNPAAGHPSVVDLLGVSGSEAPAGRRVVLRAEQREFCRGGGGQKDPDSKGREGQRDRSRPRCLSLHALSLLLVLPVRSTLASDGQSQGFPGEGLRWGPPDLGGNVDGANRVDRDPGNQVAGLADFRCFSHTLCLQLIDQRGAS